MCKLYTEVLEKKAQQRELIGKLVVKGCTANVIPGADVAAALCELVEQLEDLEMDIPMMASYIASWAADVIGPGNASFSDFGAALKLESGKGAKLFCKILVAVAKGSSEEHARGLWEASKLDLKQYMNEEDRGNESGYAQDQGVGWLYPLLGCQQYLDKAFKDGADVKDVLDWLNANVSEPLLKSVMGARCLMRLLLANFAKPEQKEGLKKYGKLAEDLYSTNTKLQLAMIYEVQLFCNELNFEAGLVKRLFHEIYDYDLVTEDAFTLWKEDTDESTPGKRRALLDANAFLQWLAEAEEEDEDDEE